MVADDDLVSRRMLERIARSAGITHVLQCRSIGEMYSVFERTEGRGEKVIAAIVDLGLEYDSGDPEDVIIFFRNKAVPLIFVSGYVDDEIRIAMRLGGAEIYGKDEFSPELLREMLNKWKKNDYG